MPKQDTISTSQSSNLSRLGKLNRLAQSVYESNKENPAFTFMDITSPEVKQFLQSLHTHQVKYMLVGGIATVFHGHIRTTQDLDLWVKETPENKERLVKVLLEVDVPGAESYLNIPMIPGWSTVTIGEHGFVADFMGYMKAFTKDEFDSCYQDARKGEFEGIPITIIHINDLIKEKKSLARPKDLDDVENLERIRKEKGEKEQGEKEG